MAETPTETKPKEKPKAAKPQYVTMDQLNEALGPIADLLEQIAKPKPTVIELPTPEANAPVIQPVPAEVKNATPAAQMNPEWDAMAREIIGDEYVDHTEFVYLKGGGLLFTVVIRRAKSNVPEDYLAMYGSDRRSKEIGQDGIAGVELWCKLIRQNLKIAEGK